MSAITTCGCGLREEDSEEDSEPASEFEDRMTDLLEEAEWEKNAACALRVEAKLRNDVLFDKLVLK